MEPEKIKIFGQTIERKYLDGTNVHYNIRMEAKKFQKLDEVGVVTYTDLTPYFEKELSGHRLLKVTFWNIRKQSESTCFGDDAIELIVLTDNDNIHIVEVQN